MIGFLFRHIQTNSDELFQTIYSLQPFGNDIINIINNLWNVNRKSASRLGIIRTITTALLTITKMVVYLIIIVGSIKKVKSLTGAN